MKKIGKGMCAAMAGVMLVSGAGVLAACGGSEEPPTGEYEHLSSADLPATTSVISVETYRDKVKGGLVGSMAGVAYGYPVEFHYKNWIPESSLPNWYDTLIQNAYDQDDIYLSVTAIEALEELGLDVTSRALGIYMYNKDFEFWNGSNNDVLARGFAPPFSEVFDDVFHGGLSGREQLSVRGVLRGLPRAEHDGICQRYLPPFCGDLLLRRRDLCDAVRRRHVRRSVLHR